MFLPVLLMANLAAAHVIWKTPGSITFASADGADLWLIEAGGGLDAPKASLVRVSPSGTERVVTFSGHAFSPVADAENVYLVVDKDLVRVEKKPPYSWKRIAKGEVWPVGVAVDRDFVYLTNQTTKGLAGGPPDGKPSSVSRMRKSGGSLERLSSSSARNVVVDERNVYFGSETSLRAIAKEGGKERVLLEDAGSSPSLALDGDWLVTTRSGGASRLHTKSGKVEPLVDDVDIPLFVAAKEGTVYLGANLAFQGPGKPPVPAKILRLTPAPPETIWTDENQDRLAAMVLAAGRLYFALEPLGGTGGATLLAIPVSATRPAAVKAGSTR